MDKEYVRKMLPEKAPDGLISWVRKKYPEELGGGYMVFSSERIPIYPDWGEIMEMNRFRPLRHVWAARCICTECGEDFYTRKVPGLDAIEVIDGEDGQLYEADVSGGNVADGTVVQVMDGEILFCPTCCQSTQLIHARKLRGGRRKQLMVATVQDIAEYTTIIYWLVWGTLEEYGYRTFDADPMDAYAINEKGTVVRYSHSKGDMYGNISDLSHWEIRTDNRDMVNRIYHDWGSICNRKKGCAIYDKLLPDMEGATGEKTGLREYLAAGGGYPIQYLKLWRRHRNIENLVKVGWEGLIGEIIDYSAVRKYDLAVEISKRLDLTKRRPNEMLGMTKAEMKALAGKWKLQQYDAWREYLSVGGQIGPVDFDGYWTEFKENGVDAVIQMQKRYGGGDFNKVKAYLDKQGRNPEDAGLLLDARRMAKAQNGGVPLTSEELWPRDLMAAHDRLAEMEIIRLDEDKSAKLYAGFQEIANQYADLLWTDGELCVCLPQSNLDLVQEGKILRHCVGGYGEAHVNRSNVIFFIRKYRRPERSYYTLDIDMRGEPKEVQLHGYGNEHHGEHKQYRHSIPKKVRAFCDRWKREVLLPWYLKQNKKESKTA